MNQKLLYQSSLYCFDVLINHFSPIALGTCSQESFPVFVTWEKNSNLRGCIGTFKSKPLCENLKRYGLSSAFEDPRFPPVQISEVSKLSCKVSLLYNFKNISSPFDWKIGRDGIIIDFNDKNTGQGRTAVYLPNVPVEQHWNKYQTLESLIEKAGYIGQVNESDFQNLYVTTFNAFESPSVTFAEYKQNRNVKRIDFSLFV